MIESSCWGTLKEILPLLGKWMSPDPKMFPWQSPYSTMDNNPIVLIDPFGASTDDGEPTKTTDYKVQKGDNLFRIGQNHDKVTPQQIRDANPQIDWSKRGKKQDIIYPGGNLKIPIKNTSAEVVNNDMARDFASVIYTQIDKTMNSINLHKKPIKDIDLFLSLENIEGGKSLDGAANDGDGAKHSFTVVEDGVHIDFTDDYDVDIERGHNVISKDNANFNKIFKNRKTNKTEVRQMRDHYYEIRFNYPDCDYSIDTGSSFIIDSGYIWINPIDNKEYHEGDTFIHIFNIPY